MTKKKKLKTAAIVKALKFTLSISQLIRDNVPMLPIDSDADKSNFNIEQPPRILASEAGNYCEKRVT